MDFKDLSKWFWDIAKYVLTAIIISSFLGSFRDNTVLLYSFSFATVSVLVMLAIIFHKLSKRK